MCGTITFTLGRETKKITQLEIHQTTVLHRLIYAVKHKFFASVF
jgi:hypothetical protein